MPQFARVNNLEELSEVYGIDFPTSLATPLAIDTACLLLNHLADDTLKSLSNNAWHKYRKIMQDAGQAWYKIIECIHSEGTLYDTLENKMTALLSCDRYFRDHGQERSGFLACNNALVHHYKHIATTVLNFSLKRPYPIRTHSEITDAETAILMSRLPEDEHKVLEDPAKAQAVINFCDKYFKALYERETKHCLPNKHPVLVRYKMVVNVLNNAPVNEQNHHSYSKGIFVKSY